jgi:hypothetical protein
MPYGNVFLEPAKWCWQAQRKGLVCNTPAETARRWTVDVFSFRSIIIILMNLL